MSKSYDIKSIYDITSAFITDNDIQINATIDETAVTYTFKKNFRAGPPYLLRISVERGAPCKQGRFTNYKRGHIQLEYNHETHPSILFKARTENNAGRAIDKKQCEIIQIITRLLSPRFFKLLHMAEKRIYGKIETTDNTAEIFTKIYQFRSNQK